MKNWIFLVVAILGLITSYYLLHHDIQIESGVRGVSLCNISETVDCDAVSLSKYSKIYEIPVAALGAGFYMAIILLMVVKIFSLGLMSSVLAVLIFILALLGTLSSLVFAYISIFLISVICIFCFFTYFCNIIVFIISIFMLKKTGFKKAVNDTIAFLSLKSNLNEKLFVALLFVIMGSFMLKNIFLSDFMRRIYGVNTFMEDEASLAYSHESSSYSLTESIFNIISSEEAYENFFNREQVIFIDNRSYEAFKKGHISNAISMPYESPGSSLNIMTKEKLEEVSKNNVIVFYSSGFSRAYFASKVAIEDWGFDKNKVFWFKDGFHEWVKNDYPITINAE